MRRREERGKQNRKERERNGLEKVREREMKERKSKGRERVGTALTQNVRNTKRNNHARGENIKHKYTTYTHREKL